MSYDDLVARLATVADSYAAERAGIDAWYDSQLAAAAENVAQAQERLASSDAALAAAASAVDITDTEAVRLWKLLADRMKVPVGGLGEPPGPDGPDGPEHPARLLDGVRELLDEVTPARRRRGRLRRVVPALVVLVLLFGALVAGLVLSR
jgi:hypothetical protein